MSKIKLEELKIFCKNALIKEGMTEENAEIVAQVLAETDAFGTHSHGSKNLHNYIKKARTGTLDINAEPQIIAEGLSFANIDANKSFGMISSVKAMELACEKAQNTGIAIVTVKNSCHFGAAGYYANLAAQKGLIGIAMSNVDPNMTAPGARGKLLGNNPMAYASPANKVPSVFLDIAMSNVASLKVVQARKDGKQIPSTWIVDKDGLPTSDPSHYPEEGAMQPMAAHKGYGLAIMIDLLTGVLSGGCTSIGGEIPSWCFELDKPNNVCHSFIAIDPHFFLGSVSLADRVENMSGLLRKAPKAKGAERIYTPGEIEWAKHAIANSEGLTLPDEVKISLLDLADDVKIPLNLYD